MDWITAIIKAVGFITTTSLNAASLAIKNKAETDVAKKELSAAEIANEAAKKVSHEQTKQELIAAVSAKRNLVHGEDSQSSSSLLWVAAIVVVVGVGGTIYLKGRNSHE